MVDNQGKEKGKPKIIGLRFQKVGKIYHFDASELTDLQIGDFAVVETSRGRQIGQVIQILDTSIRPHLGSIKPVLRKATTIDLVQRQVWQRKEIEALINCRARATELGIKDVKFVAAEFSFDGSRLSFLYSSEGGDRVNLKSLRRNVQRSYQQSRVEFHLIGPRDVAKILGGMGACGLETRCCSKFLTEFSPISIKMAKEQGISLTPTEITGMCGRLRCCLIYEYEQYVEVRKETPKRGKRVITPMGDGKVIDQYPIKRSVMVELDEGGQYEFLLSELQSRDEQDAQKKGGHYNHKPSGEL
jgi:cell fate regulator YaaT (PSP1 superfamily)